MYPQHTMKKISGKSNVLFGILELFTLSTPLISLV